MSVILNYVFISLLHPSIRLVFGDLLILLHTLEGLKRGWSFLNR